MMMIFMVMMVVRLLTVTMVASTNLELVKEGNYLLKTFKVTFSDYVYPHLLLIGSICIFMFMALHIRKLIKFLIFKYKLPGVTKSEGLKANEGVSRHVIM